MCTACVRISLHIHARTHTSTAMQRMRRKRFNLCVCLRTIFILGSANCVDKCPNLCVRDIVGFYCAHGRLNGAPQNLTFGIVYALSSPV